VAQRATSGRELARGLVPSRATLSGVSIEASGKNMEAVCKAKEVHNRTCPWGGTATEVHLAFFDIERIGWEEGDLVCGLTVVGDASVATGMMRVTCDAEPDNLNEEEEAEEEVVDAVADRELVTTTPGTGPSWN
jgi:hypothetical protein